MTAQPHARTVRLARRRALRLALRRHTTRETWVLVALCLVSVALVVGVSFSTEYFPFSTLMVPLLVGSLLLGPRYLPWFVVLIAVCLTVALTMQESPTSRTFLAVGIQFLMAAIVLAMSFRRSRLGVAGALGESMFVDLRDRILSQGGIPELPDGWSAESALRSAGGTAFAGDFVVATRPTPERLEIVVVDVSGKGEQAGTRALLLSGAFGGLLGALPPDGFLPAANDYLLRQDWEEGFATAVHLSVDLTTGAYEVRSAGHPPAIQRVVGTDRWLVQVTDGPILGFIPDADFGVARGTLAPGDAVLLYTDGMVEEPHRDIDRGTDRLLGEAEVQLRGDFRGAAQTLVDAIGSQSDDRAMVVVSRT